MADEIEHVVLLMLENRSFDQMLGCMKGVYPSLVGIDRAVVKANTDWDGTVYRQEPTRERTTWPDPMHEWKNTMFQIGVMGRFGECRGGMGEFRKMRRSDRKIRRMPRRHGGRVRPPCNPPGNPV